jgi:hypothetical protein
MDRLTSNSLLSHHGVGLVMMIATFSTPTKAIPISGSLDAVRSCRIDWHDARSEYDDSVKDLLAAIRHCSELELSDKEKCHLIEVARAREQAAFLRYKYALDAGSYS